MKLTLVALLILVAACQMRVIVKPPPVTITPHIAPATVAVDAPLLPTVTPTPVR